MYHISARVSERSRNGGVAGAGAHSEGPRREPNRPGLLARSNYGAFFKKYIYFYFIFKLKIYRCLKNFQKYIRRQADGGSGVL
jgi:hypothetical protein